MSKSKSSIVVTDNTAIVAGEVAAAESTVSVATSGIEVTTFVGIQPSAAFAVGAALASEPVVIEAAAE